MTREPSEQGFHAVPGVMQARAGKLVAELFLLDIPLRQGDVKEIVETLKKLTAMFVDFRQIFLQVKKVVDPQAFFNIYRPLLAGHHPRGVRFHGVPVPESSASATELKSSNKDYISMAKGPSAGQSSMIILFDLALGITHGAESKQFQVLVCSGCCSVF